MHTHRIRAVAVLFALLGATACAHLSAGNAAPAFRPDRAARAEGPTRRAVSDVLAERPARGSSTLEKGPVYTNPFRYQVTYRTLLADAFGWPRDEYDPAFGHWALPTATPPGLYTLVPGRWPDGGIGLDIGVVTMGGGWLTPSGRLVAGSMGNLGPWVFAPRPPARLVDDEGGFPGMWMTVARMGWSPLNGWSPRVVLR